MSAESTTFDRERWEHQPSAVGVPRFIAFVACLGGLVAVLVWLTGPPHLPEAMPGSADIRRVLTTSDVPADAVVYLASSAAWLALGYLVVSTVLRFLARAVLRWRGATRVAQWFVRLTDLLTIPFVRRLTDGAVAGLLLTSAWLPTLPKPKTAGHAAVVLITPAASPAVSDPAIRTSGDAAQDGIPTLLLAAPAQNAVPYTVVAGDTLWTIANRFYGDGDRYPEIVAANTGKGMPNGEVFADPNLIREGWVLEIPLPAANVVADDQTLTYRVQVGDSLLSIASRFLGDSLRWSEIWDLNRGRDMGGGRHLTNPDLVLPGWTLRLPTATVALDPPAQPQHTEPPVLPAAEPTPAPVVPASSAPEPIREPPASVEADPGFSEDQQEHEEGWSPPLALAAGAAGLAVAGATAVLARRARRSRSVTAGRQRSASSGRRHGRRSKTAEGDIEWVHLAGSLLLAALVEQEFAEVRLIACREAGDAMSFVLACPPGEARAVADARFAVARRLSCAIEARVLVGEGVELTASHLRREAAALFSDLDIGPAARLLVPVGATDDEVHYLNLAAVDNVWIVGTEAATARLLESWLATLAASCAPRMYEVASDEGVPWLSEADGDGLGLRRWSAAHQSDGSLVEALEIELVARTAGGAAAEEVPIVLALLSARQADDSGRLETLLRRGPGVGIVVIFISGNGEPADPALQQACGVRVVFAGAALTEDLPAGSLLFAIGGDPPVTLRPVLVSPPLDNHDAAPDSTGRRAESVTPPSLDLHSSRAQPELSEIPHGDSVDLPSSNGDSAAPVGQHVQTPSTTAASETAEPVEAISTPEVAHVGVHDQSAPIDQPFGSDGAPTDETGDPAPPFRVRCFGAFQVEVDSRPVTNWKVQKARELLAYLLVKGGAPVPREEAWEALWPDQDAGQMQRLLSDTAYHLRRALKEVAGSTIEPLVTQGQRYHLNTALFRVDLVAYEAHLRRATTLPSADALVEYDRALALYRGSLFGAEPFEWAGQYRQEYEAKFLKAAHAAAKIALALSDGQQALSFYRAILAHDPIDEEAARGLMQCYASLGDTNGVRKAHKVLVEALRRELDDPEAQPLPETTKVWQQLTER